MNNEPGERDDNAYHGRSMAEDGAQRNAILSAALLAGLTMTFAAYRGVQTGAISLAALSLQAGLLLQACVFSLQALRLRHDFARQKARLQAATESREPLAHLSRWGDAFDEEEPLDAIFASFHHRYSLHHLFGGVVPTAILGVLTLYQFYRPVAWTSSVGSAGEASAVGILCLTAACIWLVFARIFNAASSEKLPERQFLAFAAREAQITSLIVATAVVGALVWEPLETGAGRCLSMWILAVCVEQTLRLALLQHRAANADDGPAPPPRIALREAILRHGNPLRRLSEVVEARLGISIRSSWALRFTVSSLLPTFVLVGLLFWGLSSLCVVPLDHVGIRENLGRVDGPALAPGLHWKFPWPLGRVRLYPAKCVTTTYVGFVEDPDRQPAFLWSKKHAQQEFALVLGGGSELVAVDCMLYYKIAENQDGLLDYAYRFQNPDKAVQAYAYRALMDHTLPATMEAILSTNRAEFANMLKQSLSEYCTENRLGVEIVEVALIGLHPPVEVASEYLDVISARVDADRVQQEATGEGLVMTEDARRESSVLIAEAKVEAAKRVGDALEESSEFLAIGSAYLVEPEAYAVRLWCEILEEVLKDKPFALIEASIREGDGGILLDQRGSISRDDPVTISRAANP